MSRDAQQRIAELEAQLAEAEDSVVKAIGLHQTVVAERDALKELASVQKVAELSEQLDAATKLVNLHDANWRSAEQEADTLRANNAALREACKAIVALDPDEFIPKWRSIADEALSATPADSLREYRNGVKEK